MTSLGNFASETYRTPFVLALPGLELPALATLKRNGQKVKPVLVRCNPICADSSTVFAATGISISQLTTRSSIPRLPEG